MNMWAISASSSVIIILIAACLEPIHCAQSYSTYSVGRSVEHVARSDSNSEAIEPYVTGKHGWHPSNGKFDQDAQNSTKRIVHCRFVFSLGKRSSGGNTCSIAV
jgi:hypothetical protein